MYSIFQEVPVMKHRTDILSKGELKIVCGYWGFNPLVSKASWKRKWQPTPVFLPGKSHGQRSLAGYSSWGCKRFGHNLATKQQQPLQVFMTFVVVP